MLNNVHTERKVSKKLLAAAIALAAASATNVYAQAALEEIVVTARKVQESLQDVPVAVTAMTGSFIKDLNLGSIDETLAFIPGATTESSSPSEQTYSIRGVSSGAEGASSDSGVLVMVDNEVISRDFMRTATMFDVQRLEVLRGPQGTTYGRNATAGVMHVVSNTPTDESSASVTVDVGSFNSHKIEGFVNGSVAENVTGRFSLYRSERDGYTEDAVTGDDLDGWEETALRAQLLFAPSDGLTVLVRASWSDDEGDNPGPRKAYDPSLSDNFRFDNGAADYTELSDDPWKLQNSDGLFYEREIKGISSEVHWDFDDVNFTSMTTYRDAEDKYRVDLFGTPREMVVQYSANDASTWSQEFRLDNAGTESNLHWLAGFFYLNEDHERVEHKDIVVDVLTVDPGGPLRGVPAGLDLTTTQDFSQKNETDSFGIFGEVSFSLGEHTDLAIGGRYSEDEKSYEIYHTADGVLAALLISEDVVESSISEKWDAVTGKVSLTHEISDTSMLYASYATGYKSGGFNPEPKTHEVAEIPFAEETVSTFEIGAKTELFDDTLRLNVTLFDSGYDDIQTESHLPNGGTFIENASDASVKGLEVEYTWLATDNFTLMGSYANYDHEYGNYIDVDDNDFSGNPIANVPDWTTHVSAIYTLPLDEASIDLRLDYTNRADINDDPDPDSFQSIRHAEDMIHARATWTDASGDWNVSLWGKNLADKAEKVNIGPRAIMEQRHVVYAPPRTYGVSVTYNWQ